jgi:hypothetical protein
MTYSLNGFTLFFRDAYGLSSWWERCIIVTVLTEELQELIRMLADELCKLRITSAH